MLPLSFERHETSPVWSTAVKPHLCPSGAGGGVMHQAEFTWAAGADPAQAVEQCSGSSWWSELQHSNSVHQEPPAGESRSLNEQTCVAEMDSVSYCLFLRLQVLSLSEPASRCLVTAVTSLGSRYPRPMCHAVIGPVLESSNLGEGRAARLYERGARVLNYRLWFHQKCLRCYF